MRRGVVVAWVLGVVWGLTGCAKTSAECAPEQGWECPGGQTCVGGVCGEPEGADETCEAGARRECEAGCAGLQTCGEDGTWGACETCGEGQRCVGAQCVCDAVSCAQGCCQGSTCLPGTAPAACGQGGGACAACAGLCDASRKACVACLEDSQCGGSTPRCDTRQGTCVCAKSEPSESLCTDGRDNDCDGLVDCADPDCGAQACGPHGQVCTGSTCACPGGARELECGDGKDNDCDGLVDCADPDCTARACSGTGKVCGGSACMCPGGTRELACGDGQDNDCDGLVDCADPDCNAKSCRAAAGVCDQEEVCTGGVCPADQHVGTDVVCRPSRGVCDVEERCDGVSAACPGDGKVAAGTVCRSTTGACDVAETCDGSSPACPADHYAAWGLVCRPAAGECDVAERCTGTSPACPADAFDSGRCDDGKACTTDTCLPDGHCRHTASGPYCM